MRESGPEMTAGVLLTEVGQLDAALNRGRFGATQGFRGSGVGVRRRRFLLAGWRRYCWCWRMVNVLPPITVWKGPV